MYTATLSVTKLFELGVISLAIVALSYNVSGIQFCISPFVKFFAVSLSTVQYK